MHDNCIFCKIVAGKLPCYKIYEDKDNIAFLDIFPNIKGQTVVASKKHLDSYIFNINMRTIMKIMRASKRTAKLLEKSLDASRVNVVFEGTGINHLHSKLYPAIGPDGEGFRSLIAKESMYFKTYPGFVTTLVGPRAADEDLKKVYRSIKRAQKRSRKSPK